MGLDQNIVMARSKKELNSENFYSNCIDARGINEFDYNSPALLWYNRKNWNLHTMLAVRYNLENGEWLELNEKILEDILTFITHNPDYFDGFDSVPDICKILYNYDKIRENGFSIFYEGDY